MVFFLFSFSIYLSFLLMIKYKRSIRKEKQTKKELLYLSIQWNRYKISEHFNLFYPFVTWFWSLRVINFSQFYSIQLRKKGKFSTNENEND